ncbi:MAG: redoxin domain-containing protein [Bacteroidales bacterium]|nr:redoxin domain-containing protein [Bacteroidales bacterium]
MIKILKHVSCGIKIETGLKFLFFLIPVLLSFAFCSKVEAQNFRIKCNIEGVQDSVIYMAYYFGDKTYLIDTAYRNGKSKYVFEGDSSLPGGIYILAGQDNTKYLELIIDKEQRFGFKTSKDKMPSDIEFDHSIDNTIFYDYINFNVDKRKKIEQLKSRLRNFSSQPDSVGKLQKRIDSLFILLENYRENLVADHPESFVSELITAMQEPRMKLPDDHPVTRSDSLIAYVQYRKHYWDDFDVSDDRLLRTPLFHNRLSNYFNHVLYQHPDTIIAAADSLIEMARPNKETFKYIVWYLTFTFETSKVMGFDEILVHMIDSYYATGQAYWAEESTVKSLKKRANELRNVLIGEPAPDLIILDTNNSFTSLYRYQAPYMVVLFYEYDCGHCKREIKELKKWYEEDTIGFKVFAVCTDTSLVAWKKFIRKNDLPWIHVNATRSVTPDYHTLYDIMVTPTIYLLDNKKKIIAKRLKTEQLRPFLTNYHKMRRKDE